MEWYKVDFPIPSFALPTHAQPRYKNTKLKILKINSLDLLVPMPCCVEELFHVLLNSQDVKHFLISHCFHSQPMRFTAVIMGLSNYPTVCVQILSLTLWHI